MVPYETMIYLRIGIALYVIPINPQEIVIDHPTDNDTYKVLSLGEVIVPNKPGLRKVSFSSYFPTVEDLQDQVFKMKPKTYVHAIKQAQIRKKVCRIIITRAGTFDTNMQCLITDFKTKDKGGEPGDIYYEIELTEYRSYAPEIIKEKKKKTKMKGNFTPIKKAVREKQREVDSGKLRVGAKVVVNGKYWYSSYGAKPYGIAKNLETEVRRIITTPGRAYPILVGSYGWVKRSQLKVE